MTQDSNQTTDLSTWWGEKEFDAKDTYELNPQGEIVLKEYESYAPRTMGTVTDENADMVVNLLVEKFPEVKEKVDELSKEWDEEHEDKLKLAGKVERVKEYLNHANAIGDFHALYAIVSKLEEQVNLLMATNGDKKKEIVAKAEGLVDSEEWKETAETMKNLLEEWKGIGHTDKETNDTLWDKFEAARDKFFSRKREHHEEVEKEMLQNMDLKMEVVELAEKLAASDDWKGATQGYKDLMDTWKKIGHTMHDKNEELWNRFIAAKNTFFDKKKEHYDEIYKEQEVNYEAKEKLVEQAVAIQDSEDWNKTTQQYKELMDEWKKTGRVPHDKSDEIWNRFNTARDHFFGRKREHFEKFKIELEDNYAQKIALLKRAEELQNSSQWREATQEINELMDEWKKIGPVPRKHSDAIWDRFIKARKKFFARKDENREKRKHIYEKKSKERLSQTDNFLHRLQDEIKEEEEKLADFQEAIKNITPGMKKEDELREHLTKLIGQTEHKIEHKKEKLVEVKEQLKELKEKEAEKKEEKKAAESKPTAEQKEPEKEQEPVAEEKEQEEDTKEA